MSTRDRFRTILDDLAAKAKGTLPESAGRIESAVKLVLSNDVELHDDGTATVGSRTNPIKTYSGVNGTCPCVDFSRAPDGWCSHRIARALQLRADRAMRTILDAEASNGTLEGHADDEKTGSEHPTRMETPYAHGATLNVVEGKNGVSTPEPLGGLSDTLLRGVISIHGKPFIRFSALLAEAHARGLQKLETTFVSVTADLALAQCTATFQSGLVVTDVADSSPSNVGAQVRAHWIRLSATRAAARALRNALALDMCSVEEIAHD